MSCLISGLILGNLHLVILLALVLLGIIIKEEKTLATVKDIVKHINHIKDLIGIDYIGLGSDFDGVDGFPEDFPG